MAGVPSASQLNWTNSACPISGIRIPSQGFHTNRSLLKFRTLERKPITLSVKPKANGQDDANRSSNEGAQSLASKQAQLIEQNKKLLQMQRDLLEQIEERKRLHSALMESVSANSAKSEKEFKSSAEQPSFVQPPVTEEMAAPTQPEKIKQSAPTPNQLPPVAQIKSAQPLPPPPPPRKSPPRPSFNPPLATPPTRSTAQAKASPVAPPPIPATNPAYPKRNAPTPRSLPSNPLITPRSQKPASTEPPSAKTAPPSTAPPPPAPGRPPPTPPSKKPTQPERPLFTSAVRATRPLPLKPSLPVQPPAQVPAPAPVPPQPAPVVEEPPPPPPPPLAGENVMNVVMVAAECAPWSKTGGLGDVVGALPKALARRGHRVMVVAPRYSNYAEPWDTTVRKRYNVAGQDIEIGYFHTFLHGVDYVFVDASIYHHVASNIYGGSREEVQRRMILLCKAAVEAPWHVPCGGITYGDSNLVFIANDWHTALLPVYLQAYYRDNGLMQYARSCLVIHNMAHQGRGPLDEFSRFGLPDHYIDKFQLFDPMGGEHCNVFMAGLILAHRIVTVSHGYAWECQTQEGGWGLDAVIRDHAWKLRGVVNGIDEKEWSPEIDVHLTEDGYSQYSLESLHLKAQCKAALQRELGLPVRPEVPLVGFIGRLDYQKGVDIIADAMPWLMSQDVQMVLLGTGRQDLEDMLRGFEREHPERCRSWVGFSVKMAHRITAGVDILLMPSRFEPCGLNQLYAMQYGTVPVVHSVGGLRDTVPPFDPFQNTGLGWTFDRAESSGLIHAMGNALWTYREFKDSWESLQRRAMSQDLSWDAAAQQYEEIMVAAKYTW